MSNLVKVCWTELNTPDPKSAAEFYSKALGMAVVEENMGGPEPYRMLKSGDEMVCGVCAPFSPHLEALAPIWLSYFAVSDIAKTISDTISAGGEALGEVVEIPGVGKVGLVKDTAGAICGYVQPPAQP